MSARENRKFQQKIEKTLRFDFAPVCNLWYNIDKERETGDYMNTGKVFEGEIKDSIQKHNEKENDMLDKMD